jgi:hypothetical protein
MDPRRVPDGTTEIGYTAADGSQRTLPAADGVVTPETPEDAAILDGFGLEAIESPAARPARKRQEPGTDAGEEG